MPITLDRSLLVIVIPGCVALTPWSVLFVWFFPPFADLYRDFPTLVHACALGTAIVLGTLLECIASYQEKKWDEEREKEYDVEMNWYDYLATQCDHEPAGFRYLSRMVTTLYFELVMGYAMAISLVGFAGLHLFCTPRLWKLTALLPLVAAYFATNSMHRLADDSHKVLCRTRKEMNARIAGRSKMLDKI